MNKISKILLTVIIVILIILLFISIKSCSKNTEVLEDGRIVTNITTEMVNDFDNGVALISDKNNYYIIDENFNILSTYSLNSDIEYVDGYVLLRDSENSSQYYIYDKNGNKVFSYSEFNYFSIELIEKGNLIIVFEDETYNSYTRKMGIYNLAEKKYTLYPSSEYTSYPKKYGDDMVLISDDENNKFFNIRNKAIVSYTESTWREFIDGYAITADIDDSNNLYLNVFNDIGGITKIKSPTGTYSYENNQKNGYLFDVTRIYEDGFLTSRDNSAVYNLKNGTVVNLGNSEYYSILNTPQFTEDGYALIIFENSGGTPYYTVIDGNGNKLFSPVKLNYSDKSNSGNGEKRYINYDNNLYEGNYFIAKDNGTDVILDKNNNIVLVANSGETFMSVSNNVVKVQYKKGFKTRYCFRNLDGTDVKYYK